MPWKRPSARKTAAYEPKRIQAKHEAIADCLIGNPGASIREIAAILDCTPQWLSLIINSDLFRHYLHERRADIVSPALRGVTEKITAVAHLALDRLEEKLLVTEDIREIRQSAEMALDHAGYGTRGGAATQINLSIHAVGGQVLANARALVGTRQPQEGRLIEHRPSGVEDAQPAES